MICCPIFSLQVVYDGIINQIRDGDFQQWLRFHSPLDGKHRFVVPGPASSGNAVVDVPEKHRFQALISFQGAIKNHAESAVDDLAPAHAAAIVDADPGCAAEAIANDILDGHIGSK